MKKRYVLAIALAAFLRTQAHAQNTPSGFGPQQRIAPLTIRPTQVYAADLDGDGDPDMLSASEGDGKLAWYPNDGVGSFSNQQIIANDAQQISALYAADLDGDGDQDVVTSSSAYSYNYNDTGIVWYPNDGTGTFGAPQSISGDDRNVRTLYLSDLDGDGDPDALAVLSSEIVWYENEGAGNFAVSQPVASNTNEVRAFFAADLDGDGDEDVLSAFNYYTNSFPYTEVQVVWYENKGAEGFADSQTIAAQLNDIRDLTAVDLDQDGDLDVVTTADSYGTIISWYKNDGTGNFGSQLVISTQANDVRLLSTADLDQDGDPDVLIGSYSGLSWFRNDGAGSFGLRQVITNEQSDIRSLFAIDLDGDQDVDIATASADNNQVAWYPNGGDGDFGGPNLISTSVNRVQSVETADIGGDGNQDLLSVSEEGVAWYRNDGSGNFDAPSIITGDGTIALPADLDGDGDTDVVVASYSSLVWYANDGRGNFGDPQTVATSYGVTDVRVADLDSDGNQDIIASFSSFYNLGVVWYQNNGAGTFSGSTVVTNEVNSVSSVSTADLDSDGDPDVVLTTSTYRNYQSVTEVIWLANDGSGKFSSARTVTTNAGEYVQAILADLDGDGNTDLLFASDSEVTWYQNDGQANFASKSLDIEGLSRVRAIEVADLDGDGDTDLIIDASSYASYSYNPGILWYENDGTSGFAAGQFIAFTSYSSYTLSTVTDLNGDGRDDLLTASSDEINWYENQLDQVSRPTQVNSLSLIRTADNVVLSDLQDQNTISLAAFGPSDFTVRANTIGNTAARVRFILEGPTTKTQDERAAPYALFGNVGTDYFGAAPLPGVYKLTVTPFYTQGGQSVAGEATTVTFRLQTPFINSFTLIRADDDQAVQQLQEGDVINALAFGTGSFSVRANADNAALVRFDLQGPITQARDERRAPYALFGNRGNDYFGASFLPGNYALTATPYFVGRQEQLQEGAPRTVRFSFAESNPAKAPLAYPNVFGGELFVRSPEAPEAVQLRLQSVQGGAAYSVTAQPGSKAGELRLDTRSLPAGHYVLQLVGPQGTETRHVVKQ